MSTSLPKIPGYAWLRFAVPVPESTRDAWATMDAITRGDLEVTVRRAAVDALRSMMGGPLPVLNDESQ